MAARTTGITAPRGPDSRGSGIAQRDAVELLRAVAEGVGLLRVRGDRLEATSLRHAWAQIDEGLRAGLVYAAWCQQVTLTGWLMCSRGHLARWDHAADRAVATPRWRPGADGQI